MPLYSYCTQGGRVDIRPHRTREEASRYLLDTYGLRADGRDVFGASWYPPATGATWHASLHPNETELIRACLDLYPSAMPDSLRAAADAIELANVREAVGDE
jgi:hypothetical protein